MSYGRLNCLVGETGAGKTTFIKEKIESIRKREILCYLKLADDFDIPNARLYTNFPQMLQVIRYVKDTIVIIDEAWTALPENLNISLTNPEKLDNVLSDFLVNVRKLNNFVFIPYHSFSQVPKWLIPYLHYMIRFRTQDQLQYQAQRFSAFPILSNNLKKIKIVQYKPVILKLR